MKVLQGSKIRSLLTALMIVTFALVGCSNENIVNVAGSDALENSTTKSTIRTRSNLNILKTKRRSLNKLFEQTELITVEDGGEVKVGDDKHGKSKIRFQPGDVSEDVMVTFSWESEGLLMGGAEFSPHGINFNNPVKVRLSYKDADLDGINDKDLKVWYHNEDLGQWEEVSSSVDTEKKRVTAYLNHFSRYALAAD